MCSMYTGVQAKWFEGRSGSHPTQDIWPWRFFFSSHSLLASFFFFFQTLSPFPLAEAKWLKKGGKQNIFFSLLDARSHKRFQSRLHQTSTVKTTNAVFLAIKLPPPSPHLPAKRRRVGGGVEVKDFHSVDSYKFKWTFKKNGLLPKEKHRVKHAVCLCFVKDK